MLKFRESMDQHSLDVDKDGKSIGFFQWHTGHFRLNLWPGDAGHVEITTAEMQQA